MVEPRVELLAPVGTKEALEAVIAAGADAVYMGGKRFNMRMHRKDFNFDDAALKAAVEYAHAHDVKVYVTVNNLLSDDEVADVENYIEFLDSIGVDAIIIQDLFMLNLIQKLEVSCEVHASVMMNTSNLATVAYLKDRGVTRVVTSREMTLAEISGMRAAIDMEFEYFIHGDMCYAQSGQCIYGGILFGQSSNRGKCVKPCRWAWQKEGDAEFQHHLAVKDMCMIFNLPELIQSGVTCFKIEGRMRTSEYLALVVAAYRQEIDRYYDDPVGYTLDLEQARLLYDNRVREFSTCYAFGQPGVEFVDPRGVREPRKFSQAQVEPVITAQATVRLKTELLEDLSGSEKRGKAILAVTTPTFAYFEAVLNSGAERIIIGGDAYRPSTPWTIDQIYHAIQLGRAHGVDVIYRTPSIIQEREMSELKILFDALREYTLKVMTGNVGVIEELFAADLEFVLFGDAGLNAYNSQTFNFLKNQGFQSALISLEAGVKEVRNIARRSALKVEMLVQGPARGMVSNLCLKGDSSGVCKLNCTGGFLLRDEAGCTHRVEVDQYCRNHLYLENHLCLLPILGEIVQNGVEVFRIDGTFYSTEQLTEIIKLYRRAIKFDYDAAVIQEIYARLGELIAIPFTYGALMSNR